MYRPQITRKLIGFLPTITVRLFCESTTSAQIDPHLKITNDSNVQAKRRKPLVPTEPTWIEIDESKLPPPPVLTEELVDHLERQSLVRFSNEDAVAHLEKAIRYADQLRLLDVDGVEPMISPFADILTTPLREDMVTDGDCREAVLSNAVEHVEEYFVTPPGNIPLEERQDKLGSKNNKR